MLLAILQIVAPSWYRSVWNAEFVKQMETFRQEMYTMYPVDARPIIDDAIAKSYPKWLK